MKTTKRPSINDTIAGALSQALTMGAASLQAFQRPEREVARILKRDYAVALRHTLKPALLNSIVATAQQIWPRLNRAKMKVVSPERYAEVSNRNGVRLQASPYRGAGGLALRGFYINADELGTERSLIYLNTAHHAGAVGAAFLHEMGHHAFHRTLGHSAKGIHFLIDAAYDTHLDDAVELGPDAIVALAGYPRKLALRLFNSRSDCELIAKAGPLDGEIFARVRQHVGVLTESLTLDAKTRARLRTRYRPELIHFTKLRCALLAEYDL
jgi:hypothetical protein